MPRAIAIVVVGILLLIAIVYLVSKAQQGLKGKGPTLWKVVFLITIAGIAFWFFGEGLVFRYLQ